MTEKDRLYFAKRLRQERELARKAPTNAAREAHEAMARTYAGKTALAGVF
ncbi:hypothetical protein [Sphingomicrobium arenosum]|nr:hypothetical protein [Sphingomicrobium arenosum]